MKELKITVIKSKIPLKKQKYRFVIDNFRNGKRLAWGESYFNKNDAASAAAAVVGLQYRPADSVEWDIVE